MIIDLHHHYLPPKVFDLLGGQGMMNSRYNDGKTMEFVFYHKLYEIDTQLRDMDEAGIDFSVLGMALLEPHLGAAEAAGNLGKVVIGTAQGDIHDIGKNIVAMMLKGSGFEVAALVESGLRDGLTVVVGGAPVNEEVRKYVAADLVGKDAQEAVDIFRRAVSTAGRCESR